MINVLYIHHTGDMDGSSISLLNLVSHLDTERICPTVLLARDGVLRQELESKNIPVDIIPIYGFWTFPGPRWSEVGFFANFRAFLPNKRLQRYLEDKKPDLVHINDKVLLSAGIMAHRLHYPIVWHSRSTYYITKAKINSWISSAIIRRLSDAIIAISEDEVDRFEGSPKLQIIHNSVNFDGIQAVARLRGETRKTLGLQPDELGIGFIGALTERRGAWDFIKAAGMVKKQPVRQSIKYFIVGKAPENSDGGPRAKLRRVSIEQPMEIAQRLAREANVTGDLTFLGYRKDVLNIMVALDVVVVYSRLGVLGRPPFEAMAMGTPVIVAAGHSGKSTVILDGKTGLVIPPARPEELAKAIHTLAADAQLRSQLSENGINHARINFSPETNAEKVMAIYQALVNTGAK